MYPAKSSPPKQKYVKIIIAITKTAAILPSPNHMTSKKYGTLSNQIQISIAPIYIYTANIKDAS